MKSLGLALLLNIVGTPFLATASSLASLQNPATWRSQAICDLLAETKVKSMIPMRDYLQQQGKKSSFNGQVYVVTLANGLKTVFKSYDKEGLSKEGVAGIAAYEIARWLGFPHVPPIVTRTIGQKKGTLQLFVQSKTDLLRKGALRQAIQKLSHEELAQLQLFYFVFGQWDTSPANMLLSHHGGRYFMVAIDNDNICELQQVQYGELPFVALDNTFAPCKKKAGYNIATFPFEQVRTLLPTAAADQRLMQKFVSKWVSRRWIRLNKPIRCVVHQNRIWRQYMSACKPWEDYLPAYAHSCTQETLSKLRQIDREVLHRLFKVAKNYHAPFLTPAFFDLILKRRDQAIKGITQAQAEQ